MSSRRQANRIRTLALLFSGVLPLVIQPSTLAGQIAASRTVDRMVGDLDEPISIEDLIRLLSRTTEEPESQDEEAVPSDVMAVIAQCRLMSLMSDSAALQGLAQDLGTSGVAVVAVPGLRPQFRTASGRFAAAGAMPRMVRRLSDEQPLGP